MIQHIDTILQILTLGGVAFAVYGKFRDPDVKAAQDIAVMQAQCELKHKNIDNDIVLIKENHLKHIEDSIKGIENSQVKIFTILEERTFTRK